ncbi:MAG: molecular chaperone TorD family protein [Hyphomicrobiales bacterium]|nr:molecular chaperone TorD family protein [Hyphomicrobiales bacterium]
MAILHAAGRSRVYAFLAEAFAEPDPTVRARLQRALSEAGPLLKACGDTPVRAAFTAVDEALDAIEPHELVAAYRGVFGHIASGDCPPYEGEYGQSHIFQKTQCLADNAGYYRAFGLVLGPDLVERADHISVELEFLHVLAAKEAYARAHDHGAERLAIVREATRTYLENHLARWAPAFATQLERKAESGFYAALARLLSAFIAEEASAFGATPTPATFVFGDTQPDEAPADCDGCLAGSMSMATSGGER